jgi:hypothetical protein
MRQDICYKMETYEEKKNYSGAAKPKKSTIQKQS